MFLFCLCYFYFILYHFIFILFYFISSGLEVRSANHTSVYVNSELKVFKSIKVWGDISKNLPSEILLQ